MGSETVPRPHRVFNTRVRTGCSPAYRALSSRIQNQRRGTEHRGNVVSAYNLREMPCPSVGPAPPGTGTHSSCGTPVLTGGSRSKGSGGRVTFTGAGPGQLRDCSHTRHQEWGRPHRMRCFGCFRCASPLAGESMERAEGRGGRPGPPTAHPTRASAGNAAGLTLGKGGPALCFPKCWL